LPRYVAERVLLAPIEEVWRFVAEPYHLSDWWPGISGVQPDHRGFAEGARWHVQGPAYLRRADAPQLLVVKEIRPMRRFAFELVRERIAAEVELRPEDASRTSVAVAVSGRFLLGPRSRMAKNAVNRLYDLVQTAAEL
jgi:uncharacterized protein YndB with AHSA1/START domain